VETKVSTWQSDRAPTEQLQRIFGEVNDREWKSVKEWEARDSITNRSYRIWTRRTYRNTSISIIVTQHPHSQTHSTKLVTKKRKKQTPLSLSLSLSLCDYWSPEKRDCDLRFAMASTTMRFSATSTGAEALPRRNSLTGFLTVSAKSSAKSRLRCIGRSANLSSFLRRRSTFTVRCVSGSEARQTIHDPVSQQQGLKFFTPLCLSADFLVWFQLSLLCFRIELKISKVWD